MRAPRVLYQAMVGLIDRDKELDHLCKIRNCVNPMHLEQVSHKENVRRGEGWGGINKKKHNCPQGHPYDMFETGRRCSICRALVVAKAKDKWTEKHGKLSSVV